MLRMACLQLCLLSTLADATPQATAADPPAARPSRDQRAPNGEPLALLPHALQLRLPEHRPWMWLLLEQQGATRRERNIRKGALVGFATGGLAGVGLGFLVCNAAETSSPFPPVCSLVGGLVGGLLGAGIGALVGMALPEFS